MVGCLWVCFQRHLNTLSGELDLGSIIEHQKRNLNFFIFKQYKIKNKKKKLDLMDVLNWKQ